MNTPKMTFILNNKFIYDSDDMKIKENEPISKESITLNKNENTLMLALLTHYPNIVYRQDMLEHIWQGRYVVENSLNVVVSQLRTKLKVLDPELKKCLVTAQGEGYRWRGDVENVTPSESFMPCVETSKNERLPIPLTRFPVATHISMLFLLICLLIAMLFYR